MNKIYIITLSVIDSGKSLKLYHDICFYASITRDEEKPVIVFFKNEGSKLELFPIEELAKDINEENPPELSKGGFSGVTLAYNAKSENEVDDILQSVKEVGAKVVKVPKKLSWG